MRPTSPGRSSSMFFSGAFWVLTLTNLNATAQLMAPDWIRGRAMSFYSLAFGGVLPLGAILSRRGRRRHRHRSGHGHALPGNRRPGLASPAFKLPSLDEVESPEFTEERSTPAHDETLEGGPVYDPQHLDHRRRRLRRVRRVDERGSLVRLQHRGLPVGLFRNASAPTRLTELFTTGSWEEHLAQHRRIDDASAALIAKARAFDRDEGPVTRHLIAIDVEDPPNFEDLLAPTSRCTRPTARSPTMADQDD